MEWIDAGSTNIARYRYEADSQVLTVEFRHGGTYNYYDVPQGIFDQFNASPSKGQFHAQHIKGMFRYARM